MRSQVQRTGDARSCWSEDLDALLSAEGRSRRSDPTRTQIPAIVNGYVQFSPEAYAEFGNDTAEAASSPRYRGAVREPAAAAVRQQDQEGC